MQSLGTRLRKLEKEHDGLAVEMEEEVDVVQLARDLDSWLLEIPNLPEGPDRHARECFRNFLRENVVGGEYGHAEAT